MNNWWPKEAEAITGKSDPEEMLDFFANYDIFLPGIKLGSEGSIARTSEGTRRRPAFKVAPVDTSGAGDAFMAGLLYGAVRGWKMEDAVLFANAAAAFCIQAVGCSPGIRPAEEIKRFVDRQLADGLVVRDG